MEVAYQAAWTAFWWYEDRELFSQLYGDVEAQAKGSINSYDLERLFSCWMILYAAVDRGELTSADARISERTATLSDELASLMVEEGRPSAALQARALSLEMRILREPRDSATALRELEEVVRQCEGLVGFPLQPLAEELTELGNVFGDTPECDSLYRALMDVITAREGEIAAARMLLRRGAQQLDAERPYDAIRSLGSALRRLYRNESRHDLVRALYLCGAAYERVDLLWAARGSLVTAASIALSEYWTYGDVTPLQAACFRRLKWLELRLGRLPHALAWQELDAITRRILWRGMEADQGSPDDPTFDAALGLLVLRADLWTLRSMTRLPAILERLALPRAAVATIYALGDESRLPEEFLSIFEPGEEIGDFFKQWSRQPVGAELAARPALYVALGINPKMWALEGSHKYTMSISRLHTMQPTSHANLERFLASRTAVGIYGLVPGHWRGESVRPEIYFDLVVMKKEFYARHAWEIGRHDPDAVAIGDEDAPIIPPNQVPAPVLELLQWKRARSQSS
jgi:hypothetical protein